MQRFYGQRASRFGPGAIAAVFVTMSALAVIGQSTPAAAVSVAPIDLGRATPFAIIAGASIGNTATGPTTIVRGDVGVLAAAGTVTGFPPR